MDTNPLPPWWPPATRATWTITNNVSYSPGVWGISTLLIPMQGTAFHGHGEAAARMILIHRHSYYNRTSVLLLQPNRAKWVKKVEGETARALDHRTLHDDSNADSNAHPANLITSDLNGYHDFVPSHGKNLLLIISTIETIFHRHMTSVHVTTDKKERLEPVAATLDSVWPLLSNPSKPRLSTDSNFTPWPLGTCVHQHRKE